MAISHIYDLPPYNPPKATKTEAPEDNPEKNTEQSPPAPRPEPPRHNQALLQHGQAVMQQHQQRLQQRQQRPPQQPPMPQAPPPQQAQQLQPDTPQTAAAKFNHINKSLPDGVMYQPLDEETLALIQKQQQQPKPEPQPEPKQAPSPPPENPTPLKTLAQNQHNAKIFYHNLSLTITDTTPQATYIKNSLTTMAKESEARRKDYINIIGQDFDTEAKEINANIPLPQAINLAILEETKALSTLSTQLSAAQTSQNTKLTQQLQYIITQKLITHQLLLTLLHAR